MPLVEVVRTAASDAGALATAAALAVRMGKTPVLVGDAPGFLVNRVLIPYLAEALALAVEGTPIPAIDEAMKDWGMPMGPFELLDEIGLDVSVHVLRSLNEQTGSKMRIPSGFDQALERGWLGKKSGTGFYRYSATAKKASPELNQELSAALIGSAPSPAHTSDAEAIQWRLVLPMTNEAARVLEEGVTDSTDAIDLATVLGLGLAPFRGGLARFADSVGVDQLVVRLSGLAARLGPRFEPALLLRKFAESHRMLAEFRELKRQEFEQPFPTLVPSPGTPGQG
jgi:3-hydroxyacyl-CoA dehydrogenase/enoyl-CoA hydratase/3-hydroxybutyryl-CoA epimerase